MKTPHATDWVISLERVYKRYVIHHSKPTLSERIFTFGTRSFHALKDVSFSILPGERVGIIGPNGSGKTTLLKVIAGITTPTSGTVRTAGKLVSLIDVEAGFHPDLDGTENILLNGLLIGMTRDEIRNKTAEIISFSGIGSFIREPLYTYSSGMKLRLGMSVALHSDPDIVLLDEGLGTGDMEFRRKVGTAISNLIRNRVTMLFVSHYSDYIRQYCSRIIVMENGKPVYDGGIRGEYVRKHLTES